MEQLNIQFPEAPKVPQFSQEEVVANARALYNIYNRPLTQDGDGAWYTTDFDGTHIKAEEWKEKMDNLHSPKENERKDFN
ncbi:MAG: hypothetical protein JWL92_71 [Candidatus Nomurabacteria bacterium]|nr:hypothetical protein [Candidatus Nomurabacteria bacterium]